MSAMEVQLCDMLALSLTDNAADNSDALSRDDFYIFFDRESVE